MNLAGSFANPGPPPAWAIAEPDEAPRPGKGTRRGGVGLIEREAVTGRDRAAHESRGGATATPPPLPTPSGVAARLVPVHHVLDQVASALATQPQAAVSTRDVEALERLTRRVEALKLSVIARAQAQETHRASGASSTAAWLAGATQCGGSEAASQVALATALEDDLPATKEALAAGDVSMRNAGIIAGAMTTLPNDLTNTERKSVTFHRRG